MINKKSLEDNKPQPVETLEAIALHLDDSSRQVHVGSQLGDLEKEEVIRCLHSYAKVFA